MRAFTPSHITAVVAATGLTAGALANVPVASAASVAPIEVALTAGGSLGDGTALIMGGTSIPQPNQLYLDAANQLYLEPLGFGGTLQSLFTPENISATSQARGMQILDSTILQKIANGDVSAENPLVVFGYSQSAAISSAVMRQLAGQDVPSDFVRFVLIGNPANPVGGMTVETSGLYPQYLADYVATPNNLYRADIYTHEYDGVAAFPTYPLNLLSVLNAAMGFIYSHGTYLSLTPEQISNAVLLPTSDSDTLVNYYMIPSESLPLLNPLRLIPIAGQPLYDLLEPVTRVLVNLGYGNIEHGWSPADADVVTGPGLFPTDLNFGDVVTALGNGLQQGINDFVEALFDPATYQITPLLDNPSLTDLEVAGYLFGFLPSPNPTAAEALQGISELFQAFSAMT
ncbi:PE-PPE domain-containing protein [Mycolicibacter minnesotensis]|nr:PE-PPE domain-containing protein [Mycolicibacter minnesotensis]BBY34405.1 hypothetical protein MMIN_24660 [Mycolicibacter minnesotensis]